MNTLSTMTRKSTVVVICSIVAAAGFMTGISAYASNGQSSDANKDKQTQSKRGLSVKDWKMMVKGN